MEDPAFTVLLTGPGPRGAEALRAVRAVTGLSLWRSRQLLESAPAAVTPDVPHDLAVSAAERLRRAGVPVAVRCGWCRRTLPDDGSLVGPGPCAAAFRSAAHCAADSLTCCGCEICVRFGPLPGHSPGPGR
ncbi:ribosomal protein L7/L12 [Kitasatospora sp. NPDC059577]|uniref:ribosomal protein L7/L12 n=1 Tax=Kitasatospora sp. NPDC059577 TaxID=3346873 RepID=UPI0036990367